MKTEIMKSVKKAVALSVMGAAVLAQMSCEKTDIVAGQIEYGRWAVDYYKSLDAGLVDPNNAAVTMCNYQGDGINNSVLVNITGSAVALFYKNGSNNWSQKIDGRTVMFAKPTAGWNDSYYTGRETKGDTILYRKYEFSPSPTDFRVNLTAGNEKGINIIPKTNFVVAMHDDASGFTKLVMQHKRENRYIRIRTDYRGLETYSDGTSAYVIYTDLYQVDCDSGSSRVATNSVAATPRFEKVATLKNLIDASGNVRVAPGSEIPTSREFIRN